MECDATWWTESPGGLGLSGVGLGATLRDYARFGLFVAHNGVLNGRHIMPEGWFRDAGSVQQVGGKAVNYGLLWWALPAGDPVEQGAFQAIGIFGQHPYINPREKLVIVVLSAGSKPVLVRSREGDRPLHRRSARSCYTLDRLKTETRRVLPSIPDRALACALSRRNLVIQTWEL